MYEQYYDYKYVRDQSRRYSASSMQSTVSAFKNCSAVHDVPFDSLRHKDLQSLIDNCNKKHSSLELIVSLLHQMYKYALAYEIVDRDYSSAVKINIADDDEYGVPFTDQELHALRTAKDNETSEMILIMCYSGYRVSAYKSLFVNLEEGYFQGGVKTRASKERIVPIPPRHFSSRGGSDQPPRSPVSAIAKNMAFPKMTGSGCSVTLFVAILPTPYMDTGA